MKFSPPEKDDIEKSPRDPTEMDQRDSMAGGMLDETGNAADQTCNTQPQDNAEQHSHMQVEININLGGRGSAASLSTVIGSGYFDTTVFRPGRSERTLP